jgi:tRNA pseudouridine38-40 synthase
MRYLVVCSYNGKNYFGWQKQVDVQTVQGTIEQVLSTYFNQQIIIHGSGRTDAKVHAIGQTFHFDAPTIDGAKLLYACNKMLPADIKLKTIKKVKADFHARFSVKEKVYRYGILLQDKDPFLSDYRLIHPYGFDLARFKSALTLFVGRHNFSSFTSKPDDEEGFVREIFSIKFKTKNNEVTVDFAGNGFMQGQIRMMIGTALAIASGRLEEDYIQTRLDNVNRNITSYKAGGQGLYLIKVKY